MSATNDNKTLSTHERYQLKATLQGLADNREELRLEDIVKISGVGAGKVRALMNQLDQRSDSPVVKVDDGVWWTRD